MDSMLPSDIFGGAAEVTGTGVAEALGMGSVNDLLKAMTVGDSFPAQIGDLSPGKLMATVPQDLDDVMHNAAFGDRHVLLFKMLAKSKVWSTVHQYVRKQSPGSAGRRFLLHQEGGLPVESDSTYSLESLALRYFGSVRRLPIQARLVKSIAGNTVKQQNADGALEILASAEWHLFYGDNSVNPFAPDGLKRSMQREGLVLDARGKAPTEDMIDEAMTRTSERPNWGYPTDLFTSPRINKTLRQVYANRMRAMMGDRFHPNYSLREMTFDHCQGDDRVAIHKHPLVIEERGFPDERGVGPDPSRRPIEPLIIAQPTAGAPAAGETSFFVAADAGAYIYKIVALNEAGMSRPVTTNAVNTAAGQKNSITVRDGAVPGSKQRATGFIVYRTEKGGAAGTAKEAFHVPPAANGADTVIPDLNADLPGCSDIFIVSNNKEALEMVQLLPFFNFPLGNLDTSYRWALLLFATLKVALPRHHAIIKNVRPDLALETNFADNDQSGPQAHV